jgi:hypothetical protein
MGKERLQRIPVEQKVSIMSYARMSVTILATGLAAILLLGRLAELEPHLGSLRHDVLAMSPRHSMLSAANLPDILTAMQLQHRLIGAKWEQAKLTVDLALDPDLRDAAALWRDLAELLRISFQEHDNVQQLLFRVYLIEGGNRTLCFYGDPRKSDWTHPELAALVDSEADGAAWEPFRKRIRLSITPAGKRWLSQV